MQNQVRVEAEKEEVQKQVTEQLEKEKGEKSKANNCKRKTRTLLI